MNTLNRALALRGRAFWKSSRLRFSCQHPANSAEGRRSPFTEEEESGSEQGWVPVLSVPPECLTQGVLELD